MRPSVGRYVQAALAQLVEHRIRNAGVVGSNPIGGTIFHISASAQPAKPKLGKVPRRVGFGGYL